MEKLAIKNLAFRAAPLGAVLLCAALVGCNSMVPAKPLAQQEEFASNDTFSRMFDATPAQTCEAARRALLSQGYLITTNNNELVQGTKSFQPDTDTHVQMEIRVVCTAETRDGKVTLGFVTALQDRYALKKSNNSASLGVGALGSVSLPFSSSSDAMIKVGSETITSDPFYDRFFALVQRYLVISAEEVDFSTTATPAPTPPAPMVPAAGISTPIAPTVKSSSGATISLPAAPAP